MSASAIEEVAVDYYDKVSVNNFYQVQNGKSTRKIPLGPLLQSQGVFGRHLDWYCNYVLKLTLFMHLSWSSVGIRLGGSLWVHVFIVLMVDANQEARRVNMECITCKRQFAHPSPTADTIKKSVSREKEASIL
eukprot:scaffold5295_cov164-Skeletonema_dohrnii-CCMP3373.AAC.4